MLTGRRNKQPRNAGWCRFHRRASPRRTHRQCSLSPPSRERWTLPSVGGGTISHCCSISSERASGPKDASLVRTGATAGVARGTSRVIRKKPTPTSAVLILCARCSRVADSKTISFENPEAVITPYRQGRVHKQSCQWNFWAMESDTHQLRKPTHAPSSRREVRRRRRPRQATYFNHLLELCRRRQALEKRPPWSCRKGH
jgi:hypothetical protein